MNSQARSRAIMVSVAAFAALAAFIGGVIFADWNRSRIASGLKNARFEPPVMAKPFEASYTREQLKMAFAWLDKLQGEWYKWVDSPVVGRLGSYPGTVTDAKLWSCERLSEDSIHLLGKRQRDGEVLESYAFEKRNGKIIFIQSHKGQADALEPLGAGFMDIEGSNDLSIIWRGDNGRVSRFMFLGEGNSLIFYVQSWDDFNRSWESNGVPFRRDYPPAS